MSDAQVSPSLARFSSETAALVAQVAPSVVAIRSNRSAVSGFFWRPGIVVTAEEALADDQRFAVTLLDGATTSAIVVGRDPSTDIALLRLEGGDGTPVALASPVVRTGQLVIAVGAREGGPTAVLGNVSFVGEAWHSLRGGRIDARIELNAALRRSAEGGLALDADGRAFGMTVFGPRRRVLVIPSATIERVAPRLLSHGRIARGYLGLRLQRVAVDGRKDSGAIVLAVDANGPAAIAGVRQGDIVAALDGQTIASVHSLARDLRERVGDSIEVSLLRAGTPITLAVTIGERPSA